MLLTRITTSETCMKKPVRTPQGSKVVERKNPIRVRIRLFPHCALEECKVQYLAYRIDIKKKESPFQVRLALTSSCVYRKAIDWMRSRFDDKKIKEMVVERRAPSLRHFLFPMHDGYDFL